jgi:hypothetical protein
MLYQLVGPPYRISGYPDIESCHHLLAMSQITNAPGHLLGLGFGLGGVRVDNLNRTESIDWNEWFYEPDCTLERRLGPYSGPPNRSVFIQLELYYRLLGVPSLQYIFNFVMNQFRAKSLVVEPRRCVNS